MIYLYYCKNFILFYFIIFYFILFYFILFYFILFYLILFYFILFYFIYLISFYSILLYFILFYLSLFHFTLSLRAYGDASDGRGGLLFSFPNRVQLFGLSVRSCVARAPAGNHYARCNGGVV